MRGLAYLLYQQGKKIVGTDQNIAELQDKGDLHSFELVSEESASHWLRRADLMIFTDATTPNHQLRQQAAKEGLTAVAYHQAVGQLSAGFKIVAIAGTHGKSSTTAMVGHILTEAGLDPMVLLGAAVPGWKGGARAGKGKYFVIEADEYRDHFLALRPNYIIITTIEFDHPDFFNSLKDVEQSFAVFIKRMKSNGAVVVLEEVRRNHPRIDWPVKTVTVPPEAATHISLLIPGQHMQENAALAAKMAGLLGVAPADADLALHTFPGLERRFENLGRWQGLTIISDYGHHPTELMATITAARNYFKKQRILVLLEAHMARRLEAFFVDFVNALSQADGVLICPVFQPSGRDREVRLAETLGKRLEDQLDRQNIRVWRINNYADLGVSLKKIGQQFDVVLGFSAGILDGKLRALLMQSREDAGARPAK